MKTASIVRSIQRDYFNLPVLLWLALWAAINVGPWNIPGLFDGGMASINGLRAIAPMGVIAIGGLMMLSADSPYRARLTPPEALFWLYGLAMLAAALQVKPWFNTAYWGFSFIAVLVATRVFLLSEEPLRQITRLNQLTWIVAAAVLVMLLFFARDILFEAETGYGLVNKASDVAGGAMSRATGMARFAAIPAVLAFVLFWRVRGWMNWAIALAVFAGSVSLVWFMQSRGALFSLAGTLLFIMLFMGKVPRVIAVVLFLLGLGGGLDLVPEETQTYIVEHATRGTGAEGFKSMSGRDRIFRNAWSAIQEQPYLGYGPQADRRIIGENAQNGLLYAWLSGGVLGMLGYVGGMLAAWWYFLKIVFGKFRLGPREQDMLIMTGGILAFFTLRSYPENTAALFSVDLLVQLPAMVYIAMLYRYLKVARQKQRQRKKMLKVLKRSRYQVEPGTT